jgi:hypothetical protein
MPEQTIRMQHAAAAPDLRQVVGKSRAQIGAQLDDFGLAERRVQRIGRVQKLDGGAHTDGPATLAFDHGGADHEQPVAARHDVERQARMEHAHRPRQRHVGRAHDDHLTPHAAQIGQRVARGKSAAIDDDVGVGIRQGQLDAEADGNAAAPQGLGQ